MTSVDAWPGSTGRIARRRSIWASALPAVVPIAPGPICENGKTVCAGEWQVSGLRFSTAVEHDRLAHEQVRHLFEPVQARQRRHVHLVQLARYGRPAALDEAPPDARVEQV